MGRTTLTCSAFFPLSRSKVDETAGDLVGGEVFASKDGFGGASGGGCAEENVVGNDGLGVGGYQEGCVARAKSRDALLKESHGEVLAGELSEDTSAVTEGTP